MELNKLAITLYIKHLADSVDFKGITFSKHYNGMIGNRFEMPNYSYRRTLACIEIENKQQWTNILNINMMTFLIQH